MFYATSDFPVDHSHCHSEICDNIPLSILSYSQHPSAHSRYTGESAVESFYSSGLWVKLRTEAQEDTIGLIWLRYKNWEYIHL